MKKIILLITLLFVCQINIYAEETTTTPSSDQNQKTDSAAEENSLNLASNAKSAILLETSTGKIIYQKNESEKLPMASMTKMMTLLLIMENIDSGNLKWDELVTASEHASSMGGSQIFLEPGEEMTVEELVKGICIGSGNDAAVAMAERISGTEEEFVKLMNKRAKELGLKNTNFENACGLDSDNHYSSAYDMAIIAKELVQHEKILEFTGTYEDYLRKNTDNSFWLVNTNKLVRYYQGVDGLKTGYTKTAGYCITTTAKRNNLRFITVVMGEPSSTIRNAETTAMLDYGFANYEIETLATTKKVIQKEQINLSDKKYIEIVPKENITVLNTKTGTKRNVTYQLNLDTLKLPIKKGDKVGTINIIENNKTIMKIDATVKQNIKKANLFKVYLDNLSDIIKGTIKG